MIKTAPKNTALAAYLKRTRQTASQKLTDKINAAATPENAADWAAQTDQMVFAAELIGATLTTDDGEANTIRLENKLARLVK